VQSLSGQLADRLTVHTARQRYGLAVLLTVAAFTVTLGLLAVSDDPIYAPLVGAIAVAAWFGGVGPAALSLGIGSVLALWALVEPRGELTVGSTDDMTRWLVNFAIAALIVLIAGVLRIGRQRATVSAVEAEHSLQRVTALQELSAELAGAVSSDEISHALAERAAALLGADGAALGILESDDVLVVDPIRLTTEFHVVGRRISLDDSTLLTAAVREGRTVRADDRETLDRQFPDSAAILPAAVQSALAVPLRVAGKPLGVVEFLFDRPEAVDDELEAVAATGAGLAEQALERARLYERERETRTALDRILLVAPRFFADSTSEVTEVICREARTTFGADYGVLWRIRDGELELVRSDPRRDEWPPGLRVPLANFPGLESAVSGLGASFVSDVLAEARGQGLERVRELGIRSSLRSPIVIGGRTELVLVVSWTTVIDEPDPTTIAIVRRFADQAGLAFEQLERRRAEERAAARADETERLLEMTSALSLAATRGDVGEACLTHALRHVGAEAGFVVLSGGGGTSVQMLSAVGYGEDALEAWSALGLDADVPFARAISTGEPVWAFTSDEMGAFTGAPDLGDAGWISIPLKTSAGIHGAVHVSLHEPRELSDGDCRWLQSVVSQCALALERSQLYDEEQHLREVAERLQRTTSSLSNALTQSDVADVVIEAAMAGVEATGARLFAVVEERQIVRRLATGGDVDAEGQPPELPLDEHSPIARVARRGGWWLEPPEPPGAHGERTRVAVPLVSGRRSVGVLELAWDEAVTLDDDDHVYLRTIANQGAQALDRARHFESERSIAETLQRSVLPVALPRMDGVQIAARYLPGMKDVDVGGDWFDAVELSDDRLGLVVGDVVGKGVHAAANMGQLRNALRAFSVERLKPQSVLAKLDRLASDSLETTFATVVYAIVDTKAGVLRFSSAGHPPPAVAYPDGRVELLDESGGLPLGTGLGPKYRQSVVDLPAGSIVVLYSDGLVERRGRSIDEGIDALVSAMRDAPKDAEGLLEHVLDEVTAGIDRADDIAILAARFLPVAPRPLDLTVASREDSLHLVRDAVRTWLEGTDFDRSDAEDLLLAVWEICANAIEHADEPTRDTVRVRASLDANRVRIVVDDTGQFVPSAARLDRGLGLRLAEHMASTFEIDAGERGTSVALEKVIPEGEEPLRTARRAAE
jgi:serine phosphatase RsbU (regulator of sigma subunit)/anti-sigma regulatory factor (Ser/Thr protein kinase)